MNQGLEEENFKYFSQYEIVRQSSNQMLNIYKH